ncbi:hypothetical protein [Pseudomonas sp. R3-41]
MTIKQANEIDAAYEKQYDQFNKQHDFLTTVFDRTPLADDLDTLMDKVSDARWLNVKAGWLSDTYHKFDRLDYFVARLKQDYRGKLIKSLADVPDDLKEEFSDDEAEFQAFMAEERETCYSAYDEMTCLRSDAEEELVANDYFDTIGSQPSDFELSPYEEKCLLPLVENLERLWNKHKAAGFGLMCMASHLGDTDYDLSLTQALMFD